MVIALTLVSLATCTLAPGFAFVRHLPWQPLEKICGAVAASLILLYLIAWAVFCFAPGSETGIYRAVGCVAAAIAIWQWREIREVALSFGARQALAGFGFVLAWSFTGLAMIRTYSGAGWQADWLEHFQRSLFFLLHFPANLAISGMYALPARPPMMNVLSAFFLGQIGDSFEVYQLVFTFLNLLLFLPCCLMLRASEENGKIRFLALTALFALNPMMMQNAWYPWTKMLAAFFVVLALWLYLAGWRAGDCTRIVAAFVCLAAGLLVHYSAGPYVVIIGGHYLLRLFRERPHKARELAAIAITCGLLLATWFGWSIRTYGTHTTFASNTSITSAQAYQGSTAQKVAANLLDTVAPLIVRDPSALNEFHQHNDLANLRDDAFLLYQVNLIFAMGLIGGPFALWLLYRAFERRDGGPERGFWPLFIPLAIVLGIAVVGERDPLGSAHLTLIPLIALGITLIAANFPWGRIATALLLAGCLVDFSLGIFLHLRMEHLDNPPSTTVFQGLTVAGDGIHLAEKSPDSLNQTAWNNWRRKHFEKNFKEWISVLTALPQTPPVQQMAGELKAQLADNTHGFGGWYGRHGGETRMVGDEFARFSWGTLDAPSILMLLLAGALFFQLWRQSKRFAPIAGPVPTPAKKKSVTRKR